MTKPTTTNGGSRSLDQLVRWLPGGRRNKRVEIAVGEKGLYQFSLCHRQKQEDEFLYRLFVYRDWTIGGGYLHVGGYMTISEAKAAAEKWDDPDSPNAEHGISEERR